MFCCRRFFSILLLTIILLGCSREDSFRNKNYLIALDPRWYPLNLYGKEQAMVGFSIDLLFAIGKEEDLRLEIFSTSAGNLRIGLENKQFQGILSSLLPTPSVKENFLFSNPYFLIGPVLVVQKDSDIKTLADAEGRIIGIDDDTSLVFERGANPVFLIRPYENIRGALQDLENDYIDGVIIDALEAASYIQGVRELDLRIITTPLTKEGFRLFAIPSDEGHFLIDHFNQGLQKIKEDGLYSDLLKKWGLENTEQLEEMITTS